MEQEQLRHIDVSLGKLRDVSIPVRVVQREPLAGDLSSISGQHGHELLSADGRNKRKSVAVRIGEECWVVGLQARV